MYPTRIRGFEMKKIGFTLIIMTFVIGSATGLLSCSEMFPIHKGNGKLITTEQNVSPYTKIDCSGSADVQFYASDEYKTAVTVDSNLDEFTEVFVKNNTLHIRSKAGYTIHYTQFLVKVYCPLLTEVSLSGSGSFAGIDKIITPSFHTSISGSGKVDGIITCDNFSTKISGSGKINIEGAANDADVIISGSGKFNGNNFNIQKAEVKISGSGDANMWIEDHLKAIISGSGKINYRGNPTVDSSISGSGRIRRI